MVEGLLVVLLAAGGTDVADASARNDLATLNTLLSAGNSFNASGDEEAPVLRAAGRGHTAVVARLLDAGADVDSTDRSGITPLMRAAQNGRLATVELLLARGARVNHTNVAGYAAIMWCRRNGYHEVEKILLAAGAEELANPDDALDEPIPNRRLSKQSEAIYEFLAAAKVGRKRELLALLDEGVPVDGRNRHGETALMKAAAAGHRKMVKLLLDERRADANLRDRFGYTALMVAAKHNEAKIAYDLIRAGARVDSRYRIGAWPADDGTALMLAANAGHIDVVRLLLKKRANPNSRTSTGNTALMYASREGRLDVVELLLKVGADRTLVNNDGDDARALAAGHGHHEVVALLAPPG